MTRGRPLRFLALVLGGWTTIRVIALSAGLPMAAATAEHAARPAPRVAADDAVMRSLRLSGEGRSPAAVSSQTERHASNQMAPRLAPGLRRGSEEAQAFGQDMTPPPDSPSTIAGATAADPAIAQVPAPPIAPTDAAPLVPAPARAQLPRRLGGGTWLIVRPNRGDTLAFGQLGASQAGMRLTYALGEKRRIALSARASAPLRGAGREAALGIDWQPTRLPVHFLAEQRLPLDGDAARPAAQLIGGTVLHLPLHLIAEGYAQAGGVYRRGGFADGSARLARALLSRNVFTVDLGAGAWGAAQRGVARLDTGPTLGLTLPAQGGTIRLGVDYRIRVAGRARPGSGPAVSLGSSF